METVDFYLIRYILSSSDFRNAYFKAFDYVKENLDPSCPYIPCSVSCSPDLCFPITKDNLYVLGLDTTNLTFNIFFDSYLADASY